MLKKRIEFDFKSAKKTLDKDLVAFLKQVITFAKNIAKDDKNREDTDADYMVALNKVKKQAIQSLDAFASLDNNDPRIVALKYELDKVTDYLPKEMSEDELTELIKEILSDDVVSMKHIGIVLRSLNETHENLYDKALASKIVKSFIV